LSIPCFYSWFFTYVAVIFSQYSSYITKQRKPCNADGHSSVNLLVKMLFWPSVSLKQVARMYPYRSKTVHRSSFLRAVVWVSWKKNKVWFIVHIMCFCISLVILSAICILYFYTIHFAQWLKMLHFVLHLFGSYVLKLEKADVYRLPYLSSGAPGFGELVLLSYLFSTTLYVLLCHSVWFTFPITEENSQCSNYFHLIVDTLHFHKWMTLCISRIICCTVYEHTFS